MSDSFANFLATLRPAACEDAASEYDTRLRHRRRAEAVRLAEAQLPSEAVRDVRGIRERRMPTGSAWAVAQTYTQGSRLIIGPTGAGKTVAACRIALRAAWRDFASVGYVVCSQCNRMSAGDFKALEGRRLLIVDELHLARGLYDERRTSLYGLIDSQSRTRGAALIGCSTVAVHNLDIGAERVRRFGDVITVGRDW